MNKTILIAALCVGLLFAALPSFAQAPAPAPVVATATAAPAATTSDLSAPLDAEQTVVATALVSLAKTHPNWVDGVLLAIILGLTIGEQFSTNAYLGSVTRSAYQLGGFVIGTTGLISTSYIGIGIGIVITITGLVKAKLYHTPTPSAPTA